MIIGVDSKIRTLEETTVEIEGDRIVVIHAMKVTREHLKYLEEILREEYRLIFHNAITMLRN